MSKSFAISLQNKHSFCQLELLTWTTHHSQVPRCSFPSRATKNFVFMASTKNLQVILHHSQKLTIRYVDLLLWAPPTSHPSLTMGLHWECLMHSVIANHEKCHYKLERRSWEAKVEGGQNIDNISFSLIDHIRSSQSCSLLN